jgi:hypothetical protein
MGMGAVCLSVYLLDEPVPWFIFGRPATSDGQGASASRTATQGSPRWHMNDSCRCRTIIARKYCEVQYTEESESVKARSASIVDS